MKLTVDSLRPQVDKLLVALNGYDCIPSFLNNGEFVCLDNSRGDAAKFFDVEYLSGYIFTCDDDIVYPPDYTSFMIRKIKEYRSIITLHGREYPRPFVSFRTGASYHCLCDLKRDTLLDLGGTGVMAWHSDILKVRYSDFPTPNMADVWMAKLAHEQGVSIVCAAHPAGYIQFTPCENTIWKQEKANNFKRQDKILRGFIK